MQTMLYKCPGPHEIHGGRYDYTIVDDEQIPEALAAGWFLTTPEAKAAHEAAQAEAAAAAETDAEKAAAQALADATNPPTREELEQMAGKLGIPFSARVSDKKLRALIEAAAQD